MKEIIISLLIGVFCISCYRQVITLKEPIRVYIEDDIPKTGILIWEKEIIWVSENDEPDVKIVKTNELPDDSWYALEENRFTKLGFLIKPCYIYVKKINNVVIAHEFAHLIGKTDSCKDRRSIMCTSYGAIHRPFEWFTEFKK